MNILGDFRSPKVARATNSQAGGSARRVRGGCGEGARRVRGGCEEGAGRVRGGCKEGSSMVRLETCNRQWSLGKGDKGKGAKRRDY